MSARVYKRSFDWEEARRRRAAGETYREIARALGVSDSAIYMVTKPGALEASQQRTLALKGAGVCDDCGAPMNKMSRYHGSTRCVPCANKAMATTVRNETLQCFRCRAWKPDEAFPHNRASRKSRRGRHNFCRPCLTIAKREWRERNPEKERDYQRAYKRRRQEAPDG